MFLCAHDNAWRYTKVTVIFKVCTYNYIYNNL